MISKSIRSLWKTDRRYFIMVMAVGFLPWMLSGIVGWFIADIVVRSVDHPLFGIIFFLSVSVTMALGLTPTTIVATLSGFLFGWGSFLWVVLSYLCASVLGRWLGIWLNRAITGSTRFVYQPAEMFFSRLESKPFYLLLFCRLSPVLTFALTNAALGRMRFPMATYLSATLLGMLPRTALVFYAGTKASVWGEAIRSGNFTDYRILFFVAFVIISFSGIGFISKRAIDRIVATESVQSK